MKGTRSAIRYAKALMQLANEKGKTDMIIIDVKSIIECVNQNKDFRLLLASPLVKADKKKEIFDSIFQNKIDDLTLSFVKQIVDQKRENILAVICQMVVEEYNKSKNIAKVEITTAVKLNEKSKSHIIQLLKSTYNYSEIEMSEKVDKNIIGGVVMRIGDRQLDASLKGQLQNIEKELLQA